MTVVTKELLNKYADFIKQDYINWWTQNGARKLTEIQQNMVDSFIVDFEPGSSYIRVVQGSNMTSLSSHSFIVVKPGRFPVGTILKSASWRGPAKNFARGNILTGDFKRIRWTGAI